MRLDLWESILGQLCFCYYYILVKRVVFMARDSHESSILAQIKKIGVVMHNYFVFLGCGKPICHLNDNHNLQLFSFYPDFI